MDTDGIIEEIRLLKKEIELLKEAVNMQKKKEPLGEWLPEAELREMIKISPRTLLKLRKAGRITSSSISGKCNYYRLSQFKTLLDKNEQER